MSNRSYGLNYDIVNNFTTTATADAFNKNVQEEENSFSYFSNQEFEYFSPQDLSEIHDFIEKDDYFSLGDVSENRNYTGLEEFYKHIKQPMEISTTAIENPPQQINNFSSALQQEFNNSSVVNSSSVIPHPLEYCGKIIKRRKNKTEKILYQMTEAQVSADSWKWRKYGQKVIKGTPHPRHYYRCSFSKGCSAKKQVEQSASDPSILLVSFSGQHIHNRTVRRSSKRAGHRPGVPQLDGVPPFAGVPPLAEASTPATQLPAPPANATANKMEDDEITMIPNTLMAEDIFRGFEEINGRNHMAGFGGVNSEFGGSFFYGSTSRGY